MTISSHLLPLWKWPSISTKSSWPLLIELDSSWANHILSSWYFEAQPWEMMVKFSVLGTKLHQCSALKESRAESCCWGTWSASSFTSEFFIWFSKITLYPSKRFSFLHKLACQFAFFRKQVLKTKGVLMSNTCEENRPRPGQGEPSDLDADDTAWASSMGSSGAQTAHWKSSLMVDTARPLRSGFALSLPRIQQRRAWSGLFISTLLSHWLGAPVRRAWLGSKAEA